MSTVKVGNIPLSMIKALLPIAAEEGSRFAMHSIAVITHPDEGGEAAPTLAATDGKILVTAKIPAPKHDGSKALIAVPIRDATTFAEGTDPGTKRRPTRVSVEVDTATDKVVLSASKSVVRTRMAEGHYPPIDAVIPPRESVKTWVPLSVPLLQDLLEAVAVCGRENGSSDNDEGAVVFLGIPADTTKGILVTPRLECGVTGVIMPVNVGRKV